MTMKLSTEETSPLFSFNTRRVSSNSCLPFELCSFVDNILTSIGFGPFQVIAFFLAGLTYFAFSCEVLTFTFISLEVSKKWNLDGLQFAILPAVTCVTNIIGGVLFGYLADRFGRVWPYAASMLLITVFVFASAVSANYEMLIVLRGISSIGVGGIISLLHPVLIEFLPVQYRGKVTILTGLIQGIGSCVAGGIAWWLVPRYGDYGWRLFIIATAVPSLIVFIFRLIFRVESPRYLMSHNKCEQAWKTLSLMARFNKKSLEAIISKDDFLLHNNLHMQRVNTNYIDTSQGYSLLQKFTLIFKNPYKVRTLCLLIIYNTQQMAYFGSTLFLPTLLTNLKVNPYFISFVGFTAQIPGILLMAIITEWPEFGRINTLRLFSFMSAIFFMLFAFVQTIVSIPVLTVLIYFSMVPMNTLLLTYISETYPTEIRTMATAFFTTSSSVSGTWLPFISGYLADISEQYTWLSPTVWGSVLLLQFGISFLLRKDTRGQTLHDSIEP